MVIGEFKSANLLYLIQKEKRIKKQYVQYCVYHRKTPIFEYALSTATNEFVLIFKLEKNGNNGEISNS